jgi:hypothetical protein
MTALLLVYASAIGHEPMNNYPRDIANGRQGAPVETV